MAFLSKGNALTSEKWKRGVPRAAHGHHPFSSSRTVHVGPTAQLALLLCGLSNKTAHAGTVSILLGVRELQVWAVVILGFIPHPPETLP